MALNSNGVCGGCGGRVRNIEGKRHPQDRLTAIHNEACRRGALHNPDEEKEKGPTQ